MTPDQATRIAVAFAREAAAPEARLCSACAEVLQVSGAGVTLMSGSHSGPVCSSSESTGVLEELQFSLGEGPCQDAYASGEPVGEADLKRAGPDRWPTFVRGALANGARGAFAFPIGLANSRIGVLTLYQDHVRELTDEQTADSLVVADVLARTMLSIQSRSDPGVLAEDLSVGGHRAEVHQAAGMLAVQLGVDVAEATVRLRAHAYATDRTLTAVAEDVVAGHLRLGDDRAPGGSA